MKDAIRNWLTEQFGADAELHDELYGQYAADMTSFLSALEEALANGDLPKSAATAHTMKGMALQMGDGEMAEPCKALQAAGQSGDAAACADIIPRIRELVGAL